MKKYILRMIMAVFIFIAMLPLQVQAADDEVPQKLQAGDSVLIEAELSQAYGERISSLQLSIEVTTQDGSPADAGVLEKVELLSFSPDAEVTSKAKIWDKRYHKDTGILDIYISGTEPIFQADDKLTVGMVTALDGNTEMYIRVVNDSFKVVKGDVLETVTEEQGAVRIIGKDTPVNPTEPQDPESPQNPQTPEVPVIDKSRLQSALEIAAGLTESDYTAESFSGLKKVMEEGKAVANDMAATPEEVEQLADEIFNAIGALVPVAQTSADNNSVPKEENQGNEAAKTGDWNSIQICMVLVGISLVAVGVIVAWKKYHKSSKRTA